MKAYVALAQEFEAHGVDALFGVMGDGNMQYVASYLDMRQGSFIGAVHEGGAVSMADGYSRASGRVGVATVTHGPGLTNTVTALVEATRARSSVVLLTADTPSRWSFHPQTIDISRLISATGAGLRRARRPEDIRNEFGKAVAQAYRERHPVVLDIPVDLLSADVDDQLSPYRAVARQAIGPDPDALDRALGALASARRPIILAGRGAVLADARDDLVELADLVGAMLATTVPAKGLFAGQQSDLGLFGSLSHPLTYEAVQQSDCVAAFGASLNDLTTVEGALVKGKVLVQCDSDADQLNRYQHADVSVHADAAAAARAMVDIYADSGLEARTSDGSRGSRQPVAFGPDDYTDTSRPGAVDIRTACTLLSKVLPRERASVTDAGRFLSAVWRFLDVPDPSANFQTHNFGSIGLGLATAIGAAVARPDRLTVAIVGDGGGMMNIAELSTAVRHRLPLAVLVLNDGCYGAEYAKLRNYGADPNYSMTAWPAFVGMAEAMGASAIEVNSADQLDNLDPGVWRASNLPLLLDVKADPTVETQQI